MPISLNNSLALHKIAKILYNFLPASGRPNWNIVTFASVSERIGLTNFCPVDGSKTAIIKGLLEKTFDERRSHFERLIVEIVREGIVYRDKKAIPVTIQEIDQLNGYLLELGCKYTDLCDPIFKAKLAKSNSPLGTAETTLAMRNRSRNWPSSRTIF